MKENERLGKKKKCDKEIVIERRRETEIVLFSFSLMDILVGESPLELVEEVGPCAFLFGYFMRLKSCCLVLPSTFTNHPFPLSFLHAHTSGRRMGIGK